MAPTTKVTETGLEAPGPLISPQTPSQKNPVKSTVDTALKPGWVILVLGGAGYLLSETKIFGPTLSIVLMAATIYQLTNYIGSRKAGGT